MGSPKLPSPEDATTGVATLLFGRARAKLLALLFTQPEREYYFREITRLSGLSTSTLHRELPPLLCAGLIEQREHAHRVYYRANATHPCFAELKGLIDKTAGIAPQLQRSLLAFSGRIDCAFIYGSLAAGRPTASSDIDLMVIGAVSFGEVVQATGPLAERLGRSISPSVYDQEEFQRRLEEGDSFLQSVLQKPRVDLIGASDELGKSRQPRAARAPARRAAAQGRDKSAARSR